MLAARVLLAQDGLQGLGMWREHLPYNSTIDVTSSPTRVYAATPYSIFSVELNGNDIERMSRVTGLSETGISTIRFDAAANKLIIAYTNSNLDIIEGGTIHNIPDIKRDNIPGDKTIYQIYPFEGKYYLSTGLGVIIIDGTLYEVKDSWFIGNGGTLTRVNAFVADATFFYAATAEGLKRIPRNNSDPANAASWELLSGTAGLPPGAVEKVFLLQQKLIAQVQDVFYSWNGNAWTQFYSGWPVVNSNVDDDRLLVCERLGNGDSRVVIVRPDGSVERILAQPGIISLPRQAIIINNESWVADQFGGLSRFSGASVEQFKPNSPESVASGALLHYNNVFYAAAGEVNDSWNYQYNGNGIFVLKNGIWENINRFKYPLLDTVLDIITLAVDRRDETLWAGSFGGGLVHIRPGPVFTIYKQGVLGETVGDPGSFRVAGLAFDRDNNLWISNYGAQQPLVLRKADGSWLRFTIPFFLVENALSQLLVDSWNYKWIVSPKGNGLICFDHGASIDNTGDDRWKIFRRGVGSGNLPSDEVFCIAEDKNGYIWVGTADGIAVIQCGDQVFSAQGCEAIWPVVQQGNFADYLFRGEEVRSIAVDGADRKWVATRNGVWLVNATGEKIVYHFNETNSPLLSSDVRQISIDGKTGEVFFATAKGIISFRSTATEGNANNDDILIYPNPVPPGYSGTIGIRGLVNNAIVKITEMDGRLVYQSRALGGQFTWDGRDYRGRKIASGVYLILVTDEEKKEKKMSRIVFLGK
jgi:hypothetical protein